jgi:heat shock protein HslJ
MQPPAGFRALQVAIPSWAPIPVNGSAFSFGPLAGTRKMCPNMELENYLLPFLSNVGSYEIKDGKLFLI